MTRESLCVGVCWVGQHGSTDYLGPVENLMEPCIALRTNLDPCRPMQHQHWSLHGSAWVSMGQHGSADKALVPHRELPRAQAQTKSRVVVQSTFEREFFIDNLLVRVHHID